MHGQVQCGQSTTIASDASSGPPSLTLGEVCAVMERRLSWYSRSRMTLDAVELKNGNAIVAYLSHSPNTACREVIDIRTGRLVKREVLQTNDQASNHTGPSGRFCYKEFRYTNAGDAIARA